MMNYLKHYTRQILMSALLLILFCVLLVPQLSRAFDQSMLLSDLDIPLMQNFKEEQGSRMVFDTPEGRIIEVRASGPTKPAQVLDYYRLVLPSLSWRVFSDDSLGSIGGCEGLSFCLLAKLDKEILMINIVENAGEAPALKKRTTIYFSVNPE
ncbi:MAG: hypothetical protein K9G26_01695 [Emcibacter sp.]|nr:hypothetical protein [Emcibacter sp.]